MPIHDWTRVQSGLFHEFHQSWSIRIKDALNGGVLTKGYYALVEQKVDGPEPDVIAVEMKKRSKPPVGTSAAMLDPPKAALTARVASDAAQYARKANRISIRHPLGDVVAVIEIVSPGNKDSRNSLRSCTERSRSYATASLSSICSRRPTAIRRGFIKPSGTNSPTTLLNCLRASRSLSSRTRPGMGSPRTSSRWALDSRCRTCHYSWHPERTSSSRWKPLTRRHGPSARNRSASSSNRQPHETAAHDHRRGLDDPPDEVAPGSR